TRSGLPFHDKKTTVVVPGTRELGDAPSPFRQAEHQTVPRQVVDPPVRPASARGAQVDALGPPLAVEPKAPAVLCLALDLRLPMVPFEEESRPQLLRAGDPLPCRDHVHDFPGPLDRFLVGNRGPLALEPDQVPAGPGPR